MKLRSISTILLPFLSLAACAAVDPNTLAVATAPIAVSPTQQEQVASFFAEQTRDPEAAKVRNLAGYKVINGDTIICGEFNGKNAYGGYVGYQPFYIRLRGNTVMASDINEATSAWTVKACSDAAAGTVMIQPDSVKS